MNFLNIYDLSQPIYHQCPGWPDYTPPVILREYNSSIHGFNAETITMNTHTGTHIDVPFHFFNDNKTVDQFPIETFAGLSLFLDFRNLTPGEAITAKHLNKYKNILKNIEIPIIVTGWCKKRDSTKEYLFNWPYLDKTGAEFLLSFVDIKGVGIDTLSIGGWGSPEKGRPPHEILLGAGKFIVEELDVPDGLIDNKPYLFSCFPIYLKNCGGAWVRAVAYEVG